MAEACAVGRSVTTATTEESASHRGARPVAARQTSIFGYSLAPESLDDHDVAVAQPIFTF